MVAKTREEYLQLRRLFREKYCEGNQDLMDYDSVFTEQYLRNLDAKERLKMLKDSDKFVVWYENGEWLAHPIINE